MKALILAAGAGKRLRAQTKEQNKCMLEFLSKPLIEHSLNTAASLDEIDEIVIVVGHMAEQIINTYGTSYQGKKIKYKIQSPLKGVVAAIEAAKPYLDGEEFLLLLGSEIIPNGRYKEMIEYFYTHRLHVACGVTRTADTSQVVKTYAVIQNQDGQIYRLIEKPQRAINSWLGTGSCVFKSEVLEYSVAVPVHPISKERALPDLIQTAIDNGHAVRSFDLGGEYLSICTQEDLELPETFYQ